MFQLKLQTESAIRRKRSSVPADVNAESRRYTSVFNNAIFQVNLMDARE